VAVPDRPPQSLLFLTSSKRSSGKAGGNVRWEGWGCPDIGEVLSCAIAALLRSEFGYENRVYRKHRHAKKPPRGNRGGLSAFAYLPHMIVGSGNGLLFVIADAAAQIAGSGYEAHLRNRCLVGA
jgi:hypothetical protein